ncbi:MAG: hypothetical protein MJE68_12425 [Proteobacteria bacterium]|nr:hypothetical protein [Pseudomonadota bacterium]
MEDEEIDVNIVFPDNARRREILELEVYCISVDDGCHWIGKLKDLEVLPYI